MDNEQTIMRVEPGSSQMATYNGGNPIGAMLNTIVEKGVTAENVAAMKELVGLYERMEDRGANQEYTRAMTALQSELPKVIAKSVVKNKDGTERFRFADYQTIMDAIEPSLQKHGFSVSFTIRYDGPRLIAVCRMMHAAGHEKTNEFGVRIGSGPPGCSEAQTDGAARSYARRGALCDALNIVVDHDDDARAYGAKITPEQAAELEKRAKACGADEGRLLTFAAADSYAEIRSTKFAAVDEILRKKERDNQAKGAKPAESTKPAKKLGKGDANAEPVFDVHGNIVE